MAIWTATQFDAEVRRRAFAPAASSSAPGWQAADIIGYANGELQAVAKKLRTVRTGYFRTLVNTPIVSGTAAYRFPTRAMHGVLSSVQRLDANNVIHPLDKLTESDMAGKSSVLTGTPSGYVIRGNSLVLYPVPSSSGEYLRISYPRRPNTFIAVASAGVSTSPLSSTQITLTATCASLGFTTSTPLDFIQANPPFDSLADDKTPTGASGSTLTFAAGVIPSDFAVGDYVCLATQAPVFQLPTEAFYVLAQRVANMLLAEDSPLRALGLRLQESLEADLFTGATDRDDAEADSVSQDVFP